MIVLGIDTSNQTLAVGLINNQQVLGQIQINTKMNHSITLMPAIDHLFSSVNLSPNDVDRIVVSKGPGSYTGLRIGVTTAKTLAYTLNKELVGVSSLEVLAANCAQIEGVVIPLFDARRENVYAGAYRFNAGMATVVMEDAHRSLDQLLEDLQSLNEQVYFVGADVAKFSEKIKIFLPQATLNKHMLWDIPSGITVATVGMEKQAEKDIHAFLPEYLKKVEAEEKWLETHTPGADNYVEKI